MGKVIAISGKLGSGKDTVAEMIKRNVDEVYKQTAFAKALKEVVALLAHVPYEMTLTQEGKNTYIEEYGVTLGEMLQQLGTNVLRGWRDDIWIQNVMLEIKREPETNWMITDCRFPNEAEFLKGIGALTIRVNRPVNPVAENSGRDLNHPSETALDGYDGFDYVLLNDGTLDELETKVRGMLFMFALDPSGRSLHA